MREENFAQKFKTLTIWSNLSISGLKLRFFILGRAAANDFFEDTTEMGKVFKSRFEGDLGDVQI